MKPSPVDVIGIVMVLRRCCGDVGRQQCDGVGQESTRDDNSSRGKRRPVTRQPHSFDRYRKQIQESIRC